MHQGDRAAEDVHHINIINLCVLVWSQNVHLPMRTDRRKEPFLGVNLNRQQNGGRAFLRLEFAGVTHGMSSEVDWGSS